MSEKKYSISFKTAFAVVIAAHLVVGGAVWGLAKQKAALARYSEARRQALLSKSYSKNEWPETQAKSFVVNPPIKKKADKQAVSNEVVLPFLFDLFSDIKFFDNKEIPTPSKKRREYEPLTKDQVAKELANYDSLLKDIIIAAKNNKTRQLGIVFAEKGKTLARLQGTEELDEAMFNEILIEFEAIKAELAQLLAVR